MKEQQRQSSTNRWETVWISSTDETPRCGSGRRLVVAEIGAKWVWLTPASRPEARADRIPISVYESIRLGARA